MRHLVTSILQKKPYNLLWIVALLMFAISLLSDNAAFDYTRGDAYYVYSYSGLYRLFALVLIVFWIIYLLTHRLLLSERLTTIHILATLLPAIIFFAPTKSGLGLSGIPRRYYALTDFTPSFSRMAPYLATMLVFAIGQLCLLVNLTGGTLKYFTSKGKS